jgi:tryptophan synthase alpha chain
LKDTAKLKITINLKMLSSDLELQKKTIKSLKKADGLVVGSAICKEISNSIKKRQNPVTNVTNIVKRLKNKIK